MGRLDGKVVLVTGAAGAIGSAVADAVMQHGGTAIASDLRRDGVDHALDVTSEADWARVIELLSSAAPAASMASSTPPASSLSARSRTPTLSRGAACWR